MLDHANAPKLATMLVSVALAIASAAPAWAQTRVTGAAGSSDLERVEPILVDDFDVYHLGLGEVHCGSNSKREPSGDWWSSAIHLIEEQ